jgi:outer membrane protein assembly factor BamD (BamD/ComL family)
LAEEVALLAKAEKAIHDGRASQALRSLDEHEARFRDGALAEQRMAARIQALCMLGRVPEAEAQIDRLAAQSSRSPYLYQAREACDRARERRGL